MVEYANREYTKTLLFIEAAERAISNLDTEGVPAEAIEIHGNPALIMLKGSITTVIWSENEKHFMLKYSGSKNEAISIVEGITHIK